jgi:hypothetical protein
LKLFIFTCKILCLVNQFYTRYIYKALLFYKWELYTHERLELVSRNELKIKNCHVEECKFSLKVSRNEALAGARPEIILVFSLVLQQNCYL